MGVDWEKVQEIFAAAVELPEADRAGFVAGASADIDTVREVERLLASYRDDPSFLADPLLPPTSLLPESQVPDPVLVTPDDEGRTIGPYKLQRRIGRGGMGTVYLATREDEYRREVAIKLIHRRHSRQALARFVNERQILAGLEHTNIARLYDGGTTEDGLPYLVMEYVEGLRLDVFCRRAQMSIKERLLLFQQVCAAVAFAHRNLLVHRDLKPANILVTDEGIVKLLDFGIAKSLEEGIRAAKTQPGDRMMTPAYASPEQVLGQAITTASDVYSLGVVLYELLVGKSPYQLKDESDLTLQEAIRDQEPARPSDVARVDEKTSPLVRTLRGDLDTILLKALRKAPERRYESVNALSSDIGRFLSDLPVLARGESVSYRLRKFARRNRAAVVAGVVVAVVLLGFLVALIRQTRVANRQRDRAELTLDAFVDAFSAPDPELARGREVTAREMLDQGAAKVRQSLATEPDSLATLLAAMGNVYTSLGIFDKADSLHREAHELRRGRDAEALSIFERGELEWWRRNYRAAEDLYRQALKMTADDPVQRARIQRGLGLALVWQGKEDEGASLLNDALEILSAHFERTDSEILRVLEGLGWAARNKGGYARAAELFEEVVTARRPGGPGPALGRSLADLGLVRFRQGALEEARGLLDEEALPMLRASMGENSYVAEVLGSLAVLMIRQRDYVGAEKISREALEILPSEHPGSGIALHNLGMALMGRGEVEQAEQAAGEALDQLRLAFSENHERVATNLCLLGHIALTRGNAETAKERFEKCAAVYPKGDLRLAGPWFGIGRSMEALEGCAAAAEWYRQVYELQRQGLGADHPETTRSAERLNACLETMDKPPI